MVRRNKAVLLGALLFLVSSASAEELDLLFVLDASGSMKQMTGGESQIDAAKKAVRAALGDIPSGANVGLRVYAHRENQANKDASCRDSELLVAMTNGGSSKINTSLSSVQPKGYTPIAYSLEQARGDFPPARESKKTIILLSDGEETCGGDPAAVVAKLRRDGFDVTVHVIGFNVDAKAEAQLRNTAAAGNGQYFSAKDGAALSGALHEATKAAVLIEKKDQIYGTPIRGGDSFENAVKIDPKIEYRLDHHQRIREVDYFYLEANRGDTLVAQIKTADKGISIDDKGKARENDHPYAGISINASDRSRLAQEQIIGGKFSEKSATASVPIAGRVYILVGSEYDAMSKDYSTFQVSLKVNGDLDGDKDAGDVIDTALAIEAKRYKTNHLGGADNKDVFRFESVKGARYQIGFIPGDDLDAHVSIRVFDDYKALIGEKSFPPKQGGRSDVFVTPEEGSYFIELTLPYNEDKVGTYLLELKKLSEAPAVSPGMATGSEGGDVASPEGQ